MGKNRDRVSIIAAILESANGGSSKTHIMFGANLSFSLLEKYLDVALDSGFIRLEDSKYHLTECGREYLKDYRLFEARYVGAQKLLEDLICERNSFARSCGGSNENGFERSFVDAE
jgi:predicted transcriptional regulator